MKTLNFEQMEQVNGGGCGWKGFIAFASMVCTVASAGCPPIMALGAATTADAIYNYWDCIGFLD